MNKDEALEIALEALELHGKQYPHMVKGYCLDAITAIKKALETKNEYERGFVDGMQKQMQSSVDKAVNAMTRPTYHIPSKDQREWVKLTDEEIQECLQGLPTQTIDVYARRIEAKLKEKNYG